MDTSTEVAIVGGGPAGLTLAVLLQRAGVDCVVFERQSRDYVDRRQRAGVLEYRAARMFQQAGLGDAIIGDFPFDGVMEVRIDGQPRLFDYATDVDGRAQCVIPQQFVVQRLIKTFVGNGGDLRFDALDVSLSDISGDRPRVSYRDPAAATHSVSCRYVAGCDGFSSTSRATIPAGVLTEYAHDFGVGWLTVLSDSPPPRHPLLAVSDHGYAGMFFRGPTASRSYLQCPPRDDIAHWSDDRIWEQLRLRLGDPGLVSGPIVEKRVLDMRAVVYEPMSYGRLYLVGDAAHVVTPMGGKGMNLALYDAEILAAALRDELKDGDDAGLRAYSATCLGRVWRYQEYTRWLIEMTHEAGDEATGGPFRRRLARARLEVAFAAPSSRKLFAEYQIGVV